MGNNNEPLYSTARTGLEVKTMCNKGTRKPFFPRTHVNAVKNSHGETAGQLLDNLDERVANLEAIAINSGDAAKQLKIVDNCQTNSALRALSARQGKYLLDALQNSPTITLVDDNNSHYGVLKLAADSVLMSNLEEAVRAKFSTIDKFEYFKTDVTGKLEADDIRINELVARVDALEESIESQESREQELKDEMTLIMQVLHDRMVTSLDVKAYDHVEDDWVRIIPKDHVLMSGLQVRLVWSLKNFDTPTTPWEVKVVRVLPDGTEEVLSTETAQTTVNAVIKNFSDEEVLRFKVICAYRYITFEAEDMVMFTE